MLKNIEEIVLFYAALFIRFAKEDIKCRRFIGGLDNNALEESQIISASANIPVLVQQQALLMIIARNISRRIESAMEGRLEEFIEGGTNFRDSVLKWNVSETFRNGFEFNIFSRIVAQRSQGVRITPLEEENRTLLVTFLPEEVWIGHAAQYAKDRTVRMSYDEFGEIVLYCTVMKKDLKTEVYNRIKEKRKNRNLPIA